MTGLIPIERVEQSIFVIREQKVMIDIDLANLYGVPTKRLNEQVKRNIERFPSEFMFQLTEREKGEVVAICDHLKNLRFSHQLPYVFTEHGVIMLANVLKNSRAVQVSIQIVKAFIRLRELLVSHKDLAQKLVQLEKRYDHQFKIVFDAIHKLMAPPTPTPKRRIGF